MPSSELSGCSVCAHYMHISVADSLDRLCSSQPHTSLGPLPAGLPATTASASPPPLPVRVLTGMRSPQSAALGHTQSGGGMHILTAALSVVLAARSCGILLAIVFAYAVNLGIRLFHCSVYLPLAALLISPVPGNSCFSLAVCIGTHVCTTKFRSSMLYFVSASVHICHYMLIKYCCICHLFAQPDACFI